MSQVALYARVSTSRQEEEETIESQIGAIKDRIKADGYDPESSLLYKDEGYSGAILERPSLDRLRSDCNEGKIDVIYVYDFGRFSRDLTNLMLVKDELEQKGAEVLSLHERITGEEYIDRLLLQVMGAFFEYEKKKIAQRFHNGKIQKAKRGELVGYNPPYGYRYNKKEHRFDVYEPEAMVVRQMYEWVAENGISAYGVIRKLHEHGIKPQKQRQDSWTKGPVDRILRNETYIGLHHYNKSESVIARYKRNPDKYQRQQKTGRKKRSREEWILHKVEPIISETLFYKAQSQLERFKKFKKRNVKHEYLLTGQVECPCGSKRNGDGPTGKKYYRCISRHKQYDHINRCKVGGINVVLLDALVWQKIAELLSSPKLVQMYAKKWLSEQNSTLSRDNKAEDIKRQRKAVKEEQKRYIEAYGRGLIPSDIFEAKIKTVTATLSLLEGKLSEVSQNRGKTVKIDVDQLVESSVQEIKQLDFQSKKSIVERVVDKVVASPQEVKICGYIPTQLNEEKVKYEPEYRDSWVAKRG